eukprot:1100082-Pyramimonas_sp.AAC.3
MRSAQSHNAIRPPSFARCTSRHTLTHPARCSRLNLLSNAAGNERRSYNTTRTSPPLTRASTRTCGAPRDASRCSL